MRSRTSPCQEEVCCLIISRVVSVVQHFVWNLRHAVTLVLHQKFKAVQISRGKTETAPIILVFSYKRVCCTTPSPCSEAAMMRGMWLIHGTTAGNMSLNDCFGTQRVDGGFIPLSVKRIKGVQMQLLAALQSIYTNCLLLAFGKPGKTLGTKGVVSSLNHQKVLKEKSLNIFTD
ncbi:hypothetical protein XENORESO_020134 [Xenotaenia resolanae]|uniref:Uncharacterized protein n=1 Tax=Xenotaenia resolanae TaxID=208358 RepID=A0ABV0X743_9TELE